MRRFVLARLLEAVKECALRVHSTKDMSNDAVFSSSVEGLQYHEHGLVAVRVKQILQLLHALDMFLDF